MFSQLALFGLLYFAGLGEGRNLLGNAMVD
jgi:hypothetical protein